MENALVAVSGGSDSLALLDFLRIEGKYNLIVAHVNYNYRDSSYKDMQIVESYCLKYNITFYLLELNSKEQKEGNFENWARVKRYQFFKEIYTKENCKCLFVGHHKDDVIETYYLQKSRKAIVEYYGLNKETNIQGMKVIRPLLRYDKKQLEEYCIKNDIEFGVDETNFDLRYSRNKIRHEVVSKLKEEEKNSIIEEINKLNEEKIKHVVEIKKAKEICLEKTNVLKVNKLKEYDFCYQKEILYYFLIDNLYKKISIKKSRIEDLLKKIKSNKPNIILAEYDDYILYKEYDFLVIEKRVESYCYEIKNIENKYISEEYSISNAGKKLEKIEVTKEQFPLYLKNYDGKNKSINRIFIDKKIPLRHRKTWPTIVDKFGELLLVIDIKKFYNNMRDLQDDLIEFYVCKNKGE